jgi:RNA polymerase sigma-70 factor (ECF subfamily)
MCSVAARCYAPIVRRRSATRLFLPPQMRQGVHRDREVGVAQPEDARDIVAADPDSHVLARLRAGDEGAFAELVDRWSPAMLRVARAHVGSAHSAEDAVQDTWLGVVRGLPRFEGRSSLRTWVFTILVNQARTRGAREARVVPLADLGRDELGPTVDPDRFQGPDDAHPGGWKASARPVSWEGQPEVRVLAGEALRLLGSALTELPPRQRTVVTLRDVQGLTPEEACEVLGITAQNQRVLLHRGRAALRKVLEDYYRS